MGKSSSPGSRVGRGNAPGSKRTQFEPGKSGNPAGRPPRDPELLARVRDATPAAVDLWIRLVELKTEVLIGEPKLASAAVRAAENIVAYAHGKPPQEITGAGGGPIKIDLENAPPDALQLYRNGLAAVLNGHGKELAG